MKKNFTRLISAALVFSIIAISAIFYSSLIDDPRPSAQAVPTQVTQNV